MKLTHVCLPTLQYFPTYYIETFTGNDGGEHKVKLYKLLLHAGIHPIDALL